MLVKDGVVQKMFIEPEKEGDPFEVSDADTMLAHFAPTAKKPDQVVVFSKPGCPFCVEAKALLEDKGYAPIEIPLENKVRGRVIGAVSGKGTAPPVSYTHLDVYKRQGQDRAGRPTQPARGHARFRRPAP